MPIEVIPPKATAKENERDPNLVRFDRVSPDDYKLIKQIADRAVFWVKDYKARHRKESMLDPDPTMIMMDVAAIHLSRGLKLFEWLMSNDLVFVADFVAITKHIDRSCGRIPDDVRLHHQREGH